MMTPWDIGKPRPAVRQLVAHGVLRGEVLDPGTGPEHHAIFYASQGYSAAGVDASPAAIERAQRNSERVGVQADFQVAGIATPDGLDNWFATTVDSAIYQGSGVGR